jgi:hypothetical protein
MFTLAVFNNSIEFKADTAGKKTALYCPTKIILCNVFWLVFLTAIVAALRVRLTTGLAHN